MDVLTINYKQVFSRHLLPFSSTSSSSTHGPATPSPSIPPFPMSRVHRLLDPSDPYPLLPSSHPIEPSFILRPRRPGFIHRYLSPLDPARITPPAFPTDAAPQQDSPLETPLETVTDFGDSFETTVLSAMSESADPFASVGAFVTDKQLEAADAVDTVTPLENVKSFEGADKPPTPKRCSSVFSKMVPHARRYEMKLRMKRWIEYRMLPGKMVSVPPGRWKQWKGGRWRNGS